MGNQVYSWNIQTLIVGLAKQDPKGDMVKDLKIVDLTEAKPQYKNNNGLDLYMTVFWATPDDGSDEWEDKMIKWERFMKIVAFNTGFSVGRRQILTDGRAEYILREDTERAQLNEDLKRRFPDLTFTVKHINEVITWDCEAVRRGGYKVTAHDYDLCGLFNDDYGVMGFIYSLGFTASTVCAEPSGQVRDWNVRPKGV